METRCIICGKIYEQETEGVNMTGSIRAYICRPCASLVTQQALIQDTME